jgi:hypothetical protein
MKKGAGWKHPGMRSGDYGRSPDHDHDRRAYSGIGPKNYERKDENIYEEVCEILLWNPDVDASEIDVMVKDGHVLLNGFVDSRHAKKISEQALEKVTGIVDIQNRLIIKKDLDIDSDKIIARGDDGLFTQETLQR